MLGGASQVKLMHNDTIIKFLSVKKREQVTHVRMNDVTDSGLYVVVFWGEEKDFACAQEVVVSSGKKSLIPKYVLLFRHTKHTCVTLYSAHSSICRLFPSCCIFYTIIRFLSSLLYNNSSERF